MAWTTPRTYTTGELITAAILNTHVRDNFLQTAPAKVLSAGDLLVGTDTNEIKRLALGLAEKVLKVNSDGSDIEWGDSNQIIFVPNIFCDENIAAGTTYHHDIEIGRTVKGVFSFFKGTQSLSGKYYGHMGYWGTGTPPGGFGMMCYYFRKEANVDVYGFNFNAGSGTSADSEQFGPYIWCYGAFPSGTKVRIDLENHDSNTRRAEFYGILLVIV